MTAARNAGKPKRRTMPQFACFHRSASFNALLRKCTMAVSAIADSSGKKSAKTGIRIVPSPKPEKKVRQDAPKAATAMMINDMKSYYHSRLRKTTEELDFPADK